MCACVCVTATTEEDLEESDAIHDSRRQINVDPGLINLSHYWGGVPSKSDESPLKGIGHPLFINQGFIDPGLTLPRIGQLPGPLWSSSAGK